jgi:hypothetical protein
MLLKRLAATALVGLLGFTHPAAAAPVRVTAAEQRDVMVTVYNGNLGLVKEVREVRLEPGLIETHWADVAAKIDPTSVHLRSLSDPNGLKILEQNYEYDLLSSDKLMEKYVGRKVRLYQSNGSFQEATLLSTRGPVYDINGQIHMGHFGSVVLPALPENLVKSDPVSLDTGLTNHAGDQGGRHGDEAAEGEDARGGGAPDRGERPARTVECLPEVRARPTAPPGRGARRRVAGEPGARA